MHQFYTPVYPHSRAESRSSASSRLFAKTEGVPGKTKTFLRFLIFFFVMFTSFSCGWLLQVFAGSQPVERADDLRGQAPHALAAGSSNYAGGVTRVVVEEGDTLWNIARNYAAPKEDIMEKVAAIRQLNRLSGAAVYPGQRLLIPSGN
jgi:LysM repeat protein